MAGEAAIGDLPGAKFAVHKIFYINKIIDL
jgi:hypothetical protein